MIVTDFECGGGEPTVHPQFAELLRLCSKYGCVSFPSNNSQDPRRWLSLDTAKRLTIQSALHPEAEENLERYCDYARYLIDAGCNFITHFIAHPTRISKYAEYQEYFQRRNIPFAPVLFYGDYDEQRYPLSHSEEEKKSLGFNKAHTPWISQVEPHVTRIRNFRGIPCTAGYRSLYIKNGGDVHRCVWDQERQLTAPLKTSDICGVRNCGCGLRLEKLNQMDIQADFWIEAFGWQLEPKPPAYDWIEPMRSNLDRLYSENGYEGINDALTKEVTQIYGALMTAYGKDEFPE